jgi:hypothetical protein
MTSPSHDQILERSADACEDGECILSDPAGMIPIEDVGLGQVARCGFRAEAHSVKRAFLSGELGVVADQRLSSTAGTSRDAGQRAGSLLTE